MIDPAPSAERPSLARPLILAFLGLVALAAVAVFVLRVAGQQAPDSAPAPPVAPPAASLAVPAPPAATAIAPPAAPVTAPSFDIVRIAPQGNAILAGHAAAGAEVTVQDGDRVIGRTTADAGGSWVLMPEAALPPGARALTLSEKLAGGAAVAGPGTVLMVVPGTAQAAAGATPAMPPLAVLSQPGAAPRVLQAPPGTRGGKLDLAAVDYDEAGRLRFAGAAPPGAPVRVYVDNAAAGDAVADAQGNWTLAPTAPIAPGQHRLRLDQLDAHGHVVARVELPFQREQLTASQLGDNRIVVQPGASLWRLARQTYGAGVRYTVIYQANQEQIRDPAKIYPGQVLAVPPGDATPRR